MSTDHDHDDEVTIAIGVQFNEDDTVRPVPFGGENQAILLEMIDHSETPADPTDGWDLDADCDYGVKVSINAFDPDTAAQLLRAAADFLETTEWEEGDEA